MKSRRTYQVQTIMMMMDHQQKRETKRVKLLHQKQKGELLKAHNRYSTWYGVITL